MLSSLTVLSCKATDVAPPQLFLEMREGNRFFRFYSPFFPSGPVNRQKNSVPCVYLCLCMQTESKSRQIFGLKGRFIAFLKKATRKKKEPLWLQLPLQTENDSDLAKNTEINREREKR